MPCVQFKNTSIDLNLQHFERYREKQLKKKQVTHDAKH